MNRITDAYLKYYSKVSCKNGIKTKEFIKNYQQNYKSNGYGYINLAYYIQTNGDAKLIECAEKYIKDLMRLNEINELKKFEGFTYMTVEELADLKPLNVIVDAKNGEPNQKWHFIVSYLGLNAYLGCMSRIWMISCPELWIWLFESVPTEFSEEIVEKVYENAVLYKEKKINYREWKSFLKPYRQKLHEIVMAEYSEEDVKKY